MGNFSTFLLPYPYFQKGKSTARKCHHSTLKVPRNTVHHWGTFLIQPRSPAWENSELPEFQPDISDYKQHHFAYFLRERKEVTGRESKLQEKEEMNHFLSLRPEHTQAGRGVGRVGWGGE